jgi:hypothetical protein
MSNLAEQIDDLTEVLPFLDERSRGFAESLIEQFKSRGSLSPRQEPWVTELFQRAMRPDAPTATVGSVKGIVDLLERAAKHLKYPALLALVQCEPCQQFTAAGHRHKPVGPCTCPRCVGTCTCQEFRLNVAGAQARVPGSLNVTEIGRFESREWLGRITREGEYQPSRKLAATAQTAIAAALTALATDPAQAAREYGKLTGVCCFCAQKLTDKRSTDMGYGPICAGHWGLPWGAK